jgi:hypothetical protein
MATRDRQFSLAAHITTVSDIRARQFALAAHVRVTPLSAPIQARQFSISTHSRIIPRRRVINPTASIALSFPYRTNQPNEDEQ